MGNQPPISKYKGTSLIKKIAPLGPYNKTMPKTLEWP